MKRLILSALAALSASACATVTRGTAQDFTVETTPPGAEVRTSNGFECPSTPCTFRMQRKTGFTVNVELDGYLPARAVVTSDLSSGGATGMAGNVLIGGLIGIGVDAMSGATQDLRPNPLRIELQPVTPPAIEPPEATAPSALSAKTEIAPNAEPQPASNTPQ